jgi:hypothetical protein
MLGFAGFRCEVWANDSPMTRDTERLALIMPPLTELNHGPMTPKESARG